MLPRLQLNFNLSKTWALDRRSSARAREKSLFGLDGACCSRYEISLTVFPIASQRLLSHFAGLVQTHAQHRGSLEREARRANEILFVQSLRSGTRIRPATGDDANCSRTMQTTGAQSDRIRHAHHLHTESEQGNSRNIL